MSAHYNSAKGRWFFEFDKVIHGSRVRAVKTLPAGWNRAKAEAYSKAETDRLYAIATGTTKERVKIESAVAEYIKHQCPKLKNGDGVIKELARIHWAYKDRYMDELAEVAREYSANAVHDVKDASGNISEVPLSPASIRNKLSYLRAACRYAQKHHAMAIGETFNISMPVVKNSRKFYASRREMIAIARACTHKQTRALIRLGFYSGMRLGEMMTIGKTGSILEDGFMLIDTKNGEDRFVPMHPKAVVLCQYFPIPFQKRWIQRHFERARDAVGMGHFHFHDLRHSAASSLANSGATLDQIGDLLGHKDRNSTKRYSHLTRGTMAALIRKIG